MTDIVILADGGAGIGFGHIMRCLAIKNAWQNGTAKLLVQMEGGELIPDGGVAVNWLWEIEALKHFASPNTLLLVDSYHPDIDYFRYLKSIFPFVAVLDDYNRISYPVDLVICPGVYGKDMDYSNQSAITAGGGEYVILRNEILMAKQLTVREELQTILVTLGGSQHDETFFQKLINFLEGAGYELAVVAGNEKIAMRLSSKRSSIYGKLDPIEMVEIMTSVDVAVSAAGQTLNELAWLGVPTISVKTGEDQHGNWDYYRQQDLSLATVLPSDDALEATLVRILKNETVNSRSKRSKQLKKLLTATGAVHICSLIKNMGKVVNE